MMVIMFLVTVCQKRDDVTIESPILVFKNHCSALYSTQYNEIELAQIIPGVRMGDHRSFANVFCFQKKKLWEIIAWPTICPRNYWLAATM